MTEPTNVTCRNCGRPTGPHFCGFCGQEVEERRRPLANLVGDFLSEWVSFDSRLARTLGALLRPGRLTTAYLKGHRAPYLRPFRLYFLASLILFASTLDLRPPRAEDVNLIVGGVRVSESQAAGRYNLSLFSEESATMWWLVKDVDQKLAHLRSMPPQELIDDVVTGVRKVLPAALVLFVPLFAGVLKLLFLRTDALYVDHLVFAVHLQSVLFLALALTWLAARVTGLGILLSILAYALAAAATLTLYLPRALRVVYRQGRLLTALKTVVLLLCYGYLLRLSVGLAMLLVILSI